MFAYSLWRPFASIAVCFCLGACAYATAVPVDYNSNKDGFRVYDVKPILIVTNAAITVQLIPNYNKAYAVQFGAFLARQEFGFEANMGFITKLTSVQDATAIIPLITELAKNALAPAGKLMAGEVGGGAGDRFQVFDFIFDDNGSLIELRPLIHPNDLLLAQSASAAAPKTPAPK